MFDSSCLYNRERKHLARSANQDDETASEKETYRLVFSELLIYVIESKTNKEGPIVFRLADLVNLHCQRLQQLGIENPTVNSTRLKEQLLAEIPELEAHTKGRDVLLAFKTDIGTALSQAFGYSEAIIVSKAAKILRRHMMDHKSTFDRTFDDNCVENSNPSLLLQFVYMIGHGSDIKSQFKFGASKTDLSMSQLLQYNCNSK